MCKLKECFESGWKLELFDDQRKGNFGNKLRCYRTFKYSFGAEPYLYKCVNVEHRKNIARIRMSCHKLQIELDRYTKGPARLDPKDRLCKLCDDRKCEDEAHFITVCKQYQSERDNFYQKINNECKHFSNLDDNSKFIYIMICENEAVINMLGYSITQIIIKRNGSEQSYVPRMTQRT